MPEHAHVLLLPRAADYEMRYILVALKQPVSTAARRLLEEIENDAWQALLTVEYASRTVFRFWQPGGGLDRNIVRQRSVAAVIDYIHTNPVRRGLTLRPTDWQWSSARFWDGCDDVPIRMDPPPS
ncbi:MAG: hypothetical protein AB7Q17_06380 [Phycisphaerae bacterium]